MRRIRALSRSPALAATSFACVLLAGCRTWIPSELPLVELVAERPGSLRVYDRAGDDHVLDSPRIEQDSLVSLDDIGFASGGATRIGERIALEEIAVVQERKFSGERTTGLVLGLAGAHHGERHDEIGRWPASRRNERTRAFLHPPKGVRSPGYV